MQERLALLVGGADLNNVKLVSAATRTRIHVPGRTDVGAPVDSGVSVVAGSGAQSRLGEPADVQLEGSFAGARAAFGMLIEPIVHGPARHFNNAALKVPNDMVGLLKGACGCAANGGPRGAARTWRWARRR